MVETTVTCKNHGSHVFTVPCNEREQGRCPYPCEQDLKCGHPCGRKCSEECVQDACAVCIAKAKQEQHIQTKAKEAVIEETRKQLLEELEQRQKQDLKAGFSCQTLDIKKRTDYFDYLMVKDRVEKFVQPGHNMILTVAKVQRVTNHSLETKWLKARTKMADPHRSPLMLFHGTGAADKIAETGFKLPAKSPNNMFGQGVYFATDSTKSAQDIYTKGTKQLLLCEVLLGSQCQVDGLANGTRHPLDHLVKKGPQGRAYLDADLKSVKEKGFDSVFAPRDTRDSGGVLYDEFIVYDPLLALPRYIVTYDDHKLGSSFIPSIKCNIPSGKKHTLVELKSGRFVTNSPEEIEFRFAESQFLRMYQSPCKVTRIERIINPTLEKRFAAKKQKMGKEANEILAFHGSTTEAYTSIAEDNFDIGRLAKGSGDNGWYGAGLYFSEHPGTAQGYAKGNKSLLLSRVLIGKAYRCPGIIMGAPLEKGFDSHESPNGLEIVVFKDDQVLPSYIVHIG
eukprot:m.216691 g.216691  ORF g.216691 m.216691 type:complete len:507 (-) comp48039_c0_seq1:248-1768(-)